MGAVPSGRLRLALEMGEMTLILSGSAFLWQIPFFFGLQTPPPRQGPMPQRKPPRTGGLRNASTHLIKSKGLRLSLPPTSRAQGGVTTTQSGHNGSRDDPPESVRGVVAGRVNGNGDGTPPTRPGAHIGSHPIRFSTCSGFCVSHGSIREGENMRRAVFAVFLSFLCF